MRNLISLGCLIILWIGFNACHKEELKPVIDYYIQASDSQTYDQLELTLNFIRAHQAIEDSGYHYSIRSVYLDYQEFILRTKPQKEAIYLGSSDIEAGRLLGWDFDLVPGKVFVNGQYKSLKVRDFSPLPTSLKEVSVPETGKTTIIFELNMDQSISQNVNGDLEFVPVISIIQE